MRTLKFRAWDKSEKILTQPYDGDFIKWHAMSNWRDRLIVMQFTGFYDKHGVEIYEGDVLSDWNEIDGKMVQSKMQVFWCDKTGAWKLDNSFSQDKSGGDLLSDELANFTYEVTGNIYQT